MKIVYSQIYWEVGEIYNLKPTELCLLMLIYGLSQNEDECCYASKSTLAKTMNISENTVFSALRVLENGELIERLGLNSSGSGKIRLSCEVLETIEQVKEDLIERKKESL